MYQSLLKCHTAVLSGDIIIIPMLQGEDSEAQEV